MFVVLIAIACPSRLHAGPGIGPQIGNHNRDGAGGRCGVGGGGAWRRAAGPPDSQQWGEAIFPATRTLPTIHVRARTHTHTHTTHTHTSGRGQRWVQDKMADEVEEDEEGNRRLWAGRGVGRGPLWVEGGEKASVMHLVLCVCVCVCVCISDDTAQHTCD